jgi:predicted secreted protein
MTLPLASLVVKAQEQVEPASETVVTEAHNGSAVTLDPGAVLVVRLSENPSTGYSRGMVSIPNMPIRLVSYRMLPKAVGPNGAPVVGSRRLAEWRFVASGESTTGRAAWLKFLTVHPAAKGVSADSLWEVRVSVPATPAE